MSVIQTFNPILAGGRFRWKVYRRGGLVDEWVSPNIVVNEGLDYLLSAALGGGTPISLWYVGIFAGNYTPQATDTAQNISTNSTESTAYTEATRPQWQPASVSSQLITNSANMAQFSINADGTVLYGGFLISFNTKGADGTSSDTLFAANRFPSSKTLNNGDKLLVEYEVQATSA